MKPEKIIYKRATAEIIKGVGGLEAASGFCRVGKSVLGDNQSINKPDSFIAIDVLADLEPLARDREGWPHVTRILCAANGGAFVKLPEPGIADGDIHQCAAKHAKEANEVTSRLFEALGSGRITAKKVRDHELVREAREAVEASVQLLAMLEEIAGEAS